MPDRDAHFTTLRLAAIALGRELADPAFDALGLDRLQPLRDELAERVGAAAQRTASQSSSRTLALKLDALVTRSPALDEFGLEHLAPLRAEVDALVRPPRAATARMLAARGPAQTSLRLP